VESISEEGLPQWIVEIEYALSDEGAYVPTEAVSTAFKNGEPQQTERYVVDAVTLNYPTSDDLFSIDFPPATVVRDHIRDIRYKVGPNGEEILVDSWGNRLPPEPAEEAATAEPATVKMAQASTDERQGEMPSAPPVPALAQPSAPGPDAHAHAEPDERSYLLPAGGAIVLAAVALLLVRKRLTE
jgi:hypothetical protein